MSLRHTEQPLHGRGPCGGLLREQRELHRALHLPAPTRLHYHLTRGGEDQPVGHLLFF